MTYDDIVRLDRAHVWHPCSQECDYEEYPPAVITCGEGAWLYRADGRRVLDAISSWWCCLFGHADRHIAERVREQLDRLEHVIFAGYTHESAVLLARRLAVLFRGLEKVFYTDNGSSAVEAALKMSFQYWVNKGRSAKKAFFCFTGAYHGETLGALAVGGIDLYAKVYAPLLMDTERVAGPDCYRCPLGLSRESCNGECAADAERRIAGSADRLAAVIVEPMVRMADGVAIHPAAWLSRIRAATAKHDVHLVCDEIAVAFGRTGEMTASTHAGIVPDIAVVSKGLTGGFLPLAAVLAGRDIYDAFYDDYLSGKAFLHSHTYTGNPLACAAGCAVFELFDDPAALPRIRGLGRAIAEGARAAFADHPHVGEVRSLGAITAVELVADRDSKKPFDRSARIGYRVYREAEARGVLLRNLGDVVYFIPPYCISLDETRFMIDTALDAVKAVLDG